MRVLFCGAPGAGHLFPLVSLLAAAQGQGHDVLVASLQGGEIVGDVPFVNIDRNVNWFTEIRALGRTHRPELLQRTFETNSADRQAYVPLAALVNSVLVDQMTSVARSWSPDVIVYDYVFPVAAVAAAALGVPAVRHDLGFTDIAPLHRLMLDEMGVALPAGYSLDVAPPSMVGGVSRGWPLRPTPHSTGGAVPPRGSRPRIAVTLGTIAPKVDGLARLEAVVSAASAVDAEFVLAMGSLDIDTLGPLPPNVHSYGWVPWDGLLRTSDAAIHHGGSGTALAALAEGIPQLVLPDGSDRFITAQAVHDRGAGIQATAADASASLVSRLLADEKLGVAAREVRDEIASMPSPGSVVRRLAAL
ncbi:glycosyltransferase [Lentzea sp. NBRC 105346]|uniref:glycosyltransferase n=1 Tax=Lentzea sp. NBRC 105346 TaxID=3032205 RepID=UPI0025528488|nr:glycosyltransferase [Lentzea sp. NBRC 105346]